MSQQQFQAKIKATYPNDKVLTTLRVLWHEWESDGWAAVLESQQGERFVVTTDHGGLVRSSSTLLMERIEEYEQVIQEARNALSLLGPAESAERPIV